MPREGLRLSLVFLLRIRFSRVATLQRAVSTKPKSLFAFFRIQVAMRSDNPLMRLI